MTFHHLVAAGLRRNFVEQNRAGHARGGVHVLGLPAAPAQGLLHSRLPQRGLEHPLQNRQLRHQPVPASILTRSCPGKDLVSLIK